MPACDEHIRPRESNKFMANSAALMSRSLSGFSDSGSGSSKQLSDVEPYCSSDVAGVSSFATPRASCLFAATNVRQAICLGTNHNFR
jgi:hypothetical protein